MRTIPVYMNIEAKKSFRVECGNKGIPRVYCIEKGTEGVIRRVDFDLDNQDLVYVCVFPAIVNDVRGVPVEIHLTRFDLIEKGYYLIPDNLSDIWDGSNQHLI